MTRYRRGLDGAPACRSDEQCPNYGVADKITCREAHRRTHAAVRQDARGGAPARTRSDAAQHGTISLYRSKSTPCQVREKCPNYGVPGKITCSDAQNKAAVERTARRAVGRPPKPRVHGTHSRWKKGCRTETACPNHGISGKVTCVQAHLVQLEAERAERAKRASGKGITGMLNRAKTARATTT